jgi:hypothetical protein
MRCLCVIQWNPKVEAMHRVLRCRGIRHETARIRHQRGSVLVVESPHVLSAQLIPAQSCRPFCVLSVRHYSQPKLSMPVPIWRLFLFSYKVQTLSHEN